MMTDSPSLKDRILAYLADCAARDAPPEDTTPAAIQAALGGHDNMDQIGQALHMLTQSGYLQVQNITPFCDLPTLAFSRTAR
jgi:hypothetical protein